VRVDVAEIGGLKINHFVPLVITNDITGLSNEERPLFFTAGEPYRHQKIFLGPEKEYRSTAPTGARRPAGL